MNFLLFNKYLKELVNFTMDKLKGLIKKVCTKEIIFYVIFGVVTTLVNICSFYIMTSLLHWEENSSNLIAIAIAVVVAYFTNKDVVFHSEADEFGEQVVEFCRFILGRLFTMAIEYIGCALLFKYVPIPALISKCIITVLVIILNFFVSKFFAFKKR